MQVVIDSERQDLDEVLRVISALYDAPVGVVQADGASPRSAVRRRPARRGTGRPRRARPGSSTAEVRRWAQQNGYQVSTRGRIPASVTAAFESAH